MHHFSHLLIFHNTYILFKDKQIEGTFNMKTITELINVIQ